MQLSPEEPIFAGSSNSRTAPFEGAYGGANPSPAANFLADQCKSRTPVSETGSAGAVPASAAILISDGGLQIADFGRSHTHRWLFNPKSEISNPQSIRSVVK